MFLHLVNIAIMAVIVIGMDYTINSFAFVFLFVTQSSKAVVEFITEPQLNKFFNGRRTERSDRWHLCEIVLFLNSVSWRRKTK